MPQGPPLLIPRLNSVLLLIAASLLIFSAVSEAADGGTPNTPIGTIHGEYSLLGAIHRTGGSGDRTLLRRGEFLTNELTLNYEQPLPAEWMATADVHVRNTNDEQLDPYDGAHVLGWTTELYNPYLRFTGGNFYADYLLKVHSRKRLCRCWQSIVRVVIKVAQWPETSTPSMIRLSLVVRFSGRISDFS